MTMKELYDQSIRPLPMADRFELATIILNEIPPQAVVDYSDEWSREDMRDLTRATLKRIENNPEYEYDGETG